jgi:hypothetical protein
MWINFEQGNLVLTTPVLSILYYYPSKRDWRDSEDSIEKRIADIKNVP